METSEALPAGAVLATDLAPLASGAGPFLTVVLNTEAGIQNAAQKSEQRWHALRRELSDRVPEDVLSAVDPLVPEAHLSGDGLFVVADGSGVRHVEHGPAPGPSDRGWWEPVPRLATALEWRQRAIPFVVALADRTGANLYGFRHGPDDRPDVDREVEGEDRPIRKVHPGGWSQRRYQERAENTWEQNAEDVARSIERLASRIEARLVLLAGDVRATTLIQESWPAGFELPVEVVSGERPWEGSGPRIPDAAQEVIDRFVESETRAIVDRFHQEKGQHDLAAEGAARTIAALSESRVGVLLVHEGAGGDATAWTGPEPIPVGSTRDELDGLGVGSPIEVPRVDAMLRAAIGTSAAVRFVPSNAGLADGVGALLRWSSPEGS